MLPKTEFSAECPIPLKNKLVAWFCIGLQLIPSLAGLIALPAMAENNRPQQHASATENGQDPFEQHIASGAVTLGNVLSDEDRSSADALSDYARGQASSLMNNSVESWLGRFGTVQSQISLDDDFSLSDSSLDWLVPLYDSPRNMLFSQLGARHKDDRNTVNLGFGYRHFPDNTMMYGFNTFYDHDLTGKNSRLGLGGELWMDYLQLSTNAYQRLSSWHQSRDFEDYDERPANGFDMRVNGFLPMHPQLGGKLVYEQYFGDEVALFGKDERQKDPYAVTLGLNYTPIPMLTIGADQRMGKSDSHDFNVNVAINYQLDRSWKDNTSPDAVDAMRQLARSRYDLVQRNNNIVLEYRKQQVIKLHLSAEKIQGESQSTQAVTAQVNSKHGLKTIAWSGDSYFQAGGTIKAVDATHYALTLPAWQIAQLAQAANKASQPTNDASRILNTYVLTAVAEDSKNNKSKQSHLTVEVLPPSAHFAGDVTVTGDNAPPDGVTPVVVAFHIVDGSQTPLPGEEVAFTLTHADGGKTTQKVLSGNDGDALLNVTSSVAGETSVIAKLSSGDTSEATVHFSDAQPDASHSLLTASPAVIAADGKTLSTLTLTLNNSQDRPVSGRKDITMTASGVRRTKLSAVHETSAGQYSATLSGATLGTASVQAKIAGENLAGLTTDVVLTGDSNTAQIKSGDISAPVEQALADGVSQAKVIVKIKDANGNPVAGQTVAFSATQGATVTKAAVTDAQGQASGFVTSKTVGTSTVTASVNKSSQSVAVEFIANTDDAQIVSGDLTTLNNDKRANGRDQIKVQAKVTDGHGNPIAEQTVNFSVDSQAATIGSIGISDSNGLAAVSMISKKAGPVTVTASVNKSSQTVSANFIANEGSATFEQGAVTIGNTNAPANGVATNSVKARVTDSYGNPVSNYKVTFTASNGADIVPERTTDANGEVVATLTSQTAGTSSVTAKVASSEQSVSVVFLADSSTASIKDGDLRPVTDNAVANGIASNRVSVIVTDKNGNAVANQQVTMSATNGADIPETVTTNKAGQASVALSSLVAGVTTVTARVNESKQTLDRTFIANSATARGSLTPAENNAVANGTDSNSVQLVLKDANDNPVPGIAVTFSATNNAHVLPASGTTDSAGKLDATLTSTTAGMSSVTARATNGETLMASVKFEPDASSAAIASGDLTTRNDGMVANGSASVLIDVKVTDQNGNVVPDQNVTFSATNGGHIPASGKTNASGIASVGLTNTQAGTSTVTATVNAKSLTVDAHFVADKNSASGTLTAPKSSAIANGTDANTLLLTTVDANNNPVSGITITFTATNGALPVPSSGVTDAHGELSTTLTSKTAGVSTVTAESSTGEKLDKKVVFNADDSTATIAVGDLSVRNDYAVASGSAHSLVDVRVSDQNGNALSGQTVTFKATNGAKIDATGVSDSSGKVTVGISSTKAGTSTVTASVNSNDRTVDAHFIADTSTARGTLTAPKAIAVADGTDANKLLLVTQDANGNPVSNINITFTATNGAELTLASGVTDANGELNTTLTSKIAGASKVTAKTSSGGSLSQTVNFEADDTTAKIDTGDLVVSDDDAVANGSDSNQVEVRVTDLNGNAVAGQQVTFSATNGATITETAMTSDSGRATVELTSLTAGTSTVTAEVNSKQLSVPTNFVADKSTAKGTLTQGKNNSVANGVATNSVKAILTDGNNNPIPGITIEFSADVGTTVDSSATTDADGVATAMVTSVIAGDRSVTAYINGLSKSINSTFIADATTSMIADGAMSIDNNHAPTDGVTPNKVRVAVTDKNGNTLSGETVQFSADNGAVIAPTGITGTDGIVVMPLTSTHIGPTSVKAKINGSEQSETVEFDADGNSAHIADGALTMEHDDAVANGTATNTVKALVTDNAGNPVANQTVTFTSSNGVEITASSTTDENGEARAILTTTRAGISKVIATVNDTSRQVDANFIADASTATLLADNISVVTDNAVANNIAANQVGVKVTDANGNTVADQDVTFTTDNISTTTIASVGTTNADGVAIVPLTSTLATSVNVTATVRSTSHSVTVNFKPDSSTARLTAFSTTKTGATADGSTQNEVLAVVKDANGNSVADADVTFSADSQVSIASHGATGSDGNLYQTAVSTQAGSHTVTARMGGVTLSDVMDFVADGSTAQIAAGDMTMLKDLSLADGTETNSVQVKVTDGNGNVLEGQAVNFTANNGANIDAAETSDANGLVVATLTNTVAGETTVTASINGSKQEMVLTFLANASTAEVAELTPVDNNALANGTATNSVKAVIKDAKGNAIPDIEVSFSASNRADIAATGTTDQNGVVVTTLTSQTAGISRVTAEVNGSALTQDVTFVADSDHPQIAKGDMTIHRDTATADGTEPNVVKVVVTDTHGNVLGGQVVNFTADNGAEIASTGTTDAFGIILQPLTSKKAGDSKVTASINDSEQSVTVNFKYDDGTAKIDALTPVLNGAVANGSATNSVIAVITDANGNAIPDAEVAFSADNAASITPVGTTNASGEVTVTVTSFRAGDTAVTAQINGSYLNTTLNFIADSSTAQIAAGDLTVVKDDSVANGSDTNSVKVTVTDQHGNAVANETVNFSADNGADIAASGTTGSDGTLIVPVTSKVAGKSTIIAKANSSEQSVVLTFSYDKTTAKVTVFNPVKNGALANGTDINSVKAVVTDESGNVIPEMEVAFTASNGAEIDATGTSDAKGEVLSTITSSVAGDSVIIAELNGNRLPTTVTFKADSSTAQIVGSDISAPVDNAIANGVSENRVRVKVTDAKGNAVEGINVDFSADNSAVIEGQATTDENGVVVMPLTNTVATTSTVIATENGSTQTISVTFVPDASTAGFTEGDLTVENDGALADGKTENQILLHVKDATGNAVPNASVTFSATNHAVIAPTGTSDETGALRLPVTNTYSGASVITASLNQSHLSVTMNFIAATPPVITEVQDDKGTVTGALTSEQPTDDATPTLSGTADPNATVRLYESNKVIGSSVATEEGVWTLTVSTPLSGDGEHSLTATGALSPTSEESAASQAFILKLDTVAEIPAITGASDDSGSIESGSTTNGQQFTLSGTAEAGATVTVKYLQNGERFFYTAGTAVADESGNWQLTLARSFFTDRVSYEFLVEQTDVAGNKSAVSSSNSFVTELSYWPAPVGTPEYIPASNVDPVTAALIAQHLNGTNALLVRLKYGAEMVLPDAAESKGKYVYIAVTGQRSKLVEDNNSVWISAGSNATYYSNGSTWTDVY